MNTPLPTWYVWGANANSQKRTGCNSMLMEAQSSEVLVSNDQFSYFQMDEEWDDWAQQLPPLVVPFADIDYLMDYQNVFSQIEKGIATSRPILSFHQGQKHRQGLWLGEGLWKWRLFEYAQKESHELLDGLIQKCVQFLAIKEDMTRFVLVCLKRFMSMKICLSRHNYMMQITNYLTSRM